MECFYEDTGALLDASMVSGRVNRQASRERTLKSLIDGKREPALIIDFYHFFSGEIVSVKGLKDILSRKAGVYKIIMFESDIAGIHLAQVAKTLEENVESLSEWSIVFTRAEKYRGLAEFQRFMEKSGQVKRILFL